MRVGTSAVVRVRLQERLRSDADHDDRPVALSGQLLAHRGDLADDFLQNRDGVLDDGDDVLRDAERAYSQITSSECSIHEVHERLCGYVRGDIWDG